MGNQLYAIALAMTPGLSCSGCRKLLDIHADPEEIFGLTKKDLVELFGQHHQIIDAIAGKTMMGRAEEELAWAEKNDVRILFITDADYPQRLKLPGCEDTPTLLYLKGACDLNAERVVSVVGTRRATEYGKDMTSKLIGQLQGEGVMVVSGLAYGIDAAAHRSSLQYGLTTVGVLGHGLDQIYPPENRGLARDMVYGGGGLITEYPSQTKINPRYFPARNRIIAALSDATIVVEAAEKGGALITAGIANGYHRDVFAVPGRVYDSYSKGCNNLIANNRANIIRTMDDLYYSMGWERKCRAKSGMDGVQQQLFVALSNEEQAIYDILQASPNLTMEEIKAKSELSLPKIANALLNMELNSIVKCLPGKLYRCY
ncbi:MAG: DNA-processing protein DprA [Bacteroidales bacterium]|nr:DNA-processing protein DprA [Bacteroidales bacterium]